jgi:iron(III) transport system permease protein
MAVTTPNTLIAAPRRASRLRVRPAIRQAGVLLFVAVLAYLVVMPLVRLQTESLSNGADGYRRAYTDPRFGETLRYTIGLAFGSLAIAMVLGTLLAWAASRLPRRLRMLRVLPILPIVVPAIASVVGWAFLLSPRPGYINAALRNLPWWSDLDEGPIDIYTMPWIIIITGFGLTAFVYLFVSAGFQNISSEHIEAAQVAGSSQWGVFFRVTLPLLRPTLIYGGGVALLLGLGQFTGPLLLGRTAGINVITTDIYRQMSQTPIEYGVAAALGSPLLMFGIVVVLLQRFLLGDQRRFVTHGGKAFRSEGRTSWFGALCMVLYSFIATVLPVAALVVVSLTRFWSAKIEPSKWSLHNFRQIFDESGIVDAIKNSVTMSLAAVLISIPVGFIAANLLLRTKRYKVLRVLLDFIVSMPLGIPAVVFGAGFLLTYTQEPFVLYGTRWVIILVYVTLMLPFTVRMQASAMVALGDGYVEAARVSGSGVVGTNLKIVLPLMRSALGGAAALMFVLLTHEFAASLLVRASTTQVMGTVLYDYWGNGTYPLVAAIALIMTAVTTIGVVVAIMIGGSDALTSL